MVYPQKETAELTQDFLLKARGVDAFLKGIPGASLQALRKGPGLLGVDAVGKVALFENLMDSHALFLTANTSTLYIFPYINTTDGPVVDVPPMMLGAFDDAWFRFVSDVGLADPTKEKEENTWYYLRDMTKKSLKDILSSSRALMPPGCS